VHVLSVDHPTKPPGIHFNFDIIEVDQYLAEESWNGRNFVMTNMRTGHQGQVVLYRGSEGGSVGNGTGHWRGVGAPRAAASAADADADASSAMRQLFQVGDKLRFPPIALRQGKHGGAGRVSALREFTDASESFFAMYQAQTGAMRTSFNGHRPLALQRKLVRCMRSYSAAQRCWEGLVVPALEPMPTDGSTAWCLAEGVSAGGRAGLDVLSALSEKSAVHAGGSSLLTGDQLTRTERCQEEVAARAAALAKDAVDAVAFNMKVVTDLGGLYVRVMDPGLPANQVGIARVLHKLSKQNV
jgi:hypothetical protein